MNAVGISARVLVHALGGLLAAAMYLRTRNLWLMIGLHGIENAPLRLLSGISWGTSALA